MKRWKYTGMAFLWDRVEIHRTDDKGTHMTHTYNLDLLNFERMKHRIKRIQFIFYLDTSIKAFKMRERKLEEERKKNIPERLFISQN